MWWHHEMMDAAKLAETVGILTHFNIYSRNIDTFQHINSRNIDTNIKF
jgi:hypothetical protein